jgi:hypothetical protein
MTELPSRYDRGLTAHKAGDDVTSSVEEEELMSPIRYTPM